MAAVPHQEKVRRLRICFTGFPGNQRTESKIPTEIDRAASHTSGVASQSCWNETKIQLQGPLSVTHPKVPLVFTVPIHHVTHNLNLLFLEGCMCQLYHLDDLIFLWLLEVNVWRRWKFSHAKTGRLSLYGRASRHGSPADCLQGYVSNESQDLMASYKKGC